MRVRVGGAWREAESGRAYIGGAWRQLKEVRAYIDGAWETIVTFAPALSLDASPPTTGVQIVGSGTATTPPVTVTPAGGIAPFTYSWARVGGAGGTAVSPTSATTRFTRTIGTGDEVTETFRCTATDTFGTTAIEDVFVSFASINPAPSGA